MNSVPLLLHYWVVILLMMCGLYLVISAVNLLKKIAGLTIFQTSVFLLFISMGEIQGGAIPILKEGVSTYANPLPQVLILTAIVVAVATMALGLALVLRIHEAYDSIDEDCIQQCNEEIQHSAAHPDGAQTDNPSTPG